MDCKRFVKHLLYGFVPAAVLLTGWYIITGDAINLPEEHHRFVSALIQTGAFVLLYPCALEAAAYFGGRSAKRAYERHGNTPLAAFGMINELTSKRARRNDLIWMVAMIIVLLLGGIMMGGLGIFLLRIGPRPEVPVYKLHFWHYTGICSLLIMVLPFLAALSLIKRLRKNRRSELRIREMSAQFEEALRQGIEEEKKLYGSDPNKQ